jgi:hypothetical protein
MFFFLFLEFIWAAADSSGIVLAAGSWGWKLKAHYPFKELC